MSGLPFLANSEIETRLSWTGRDFPKKFRRPVTLIGDGHPSVLRLHGRGLSECHYAAVVQDKAMWLVNLSARRMQRGERVRRFATPGLSVMLGSASMEFVSASSLGASYDSEESGIGIGEDDPSDLHTDIHSDIHDRSEIGSHSDFAGQSEIHPKDGPPGMSSIHRGNDDQSNDASSSFISRGPSPDTTGTGARENETPAADGDDGSSPPTDRDPAMCLSEAGSGVALSMSSQDREIAPVLESDEPDGTDSMGTVVQSVHEDEMDVSPLVPSITPEAATLEKDTDSSGDSAMSLVDTAMGLVDAAVDDSAVSPPDLSEDQHPVHSPREVSDLPYPVTDNVESSLTLGIENVHLEQRTDLDSNVLDGEDTHEVNNSSSVISIDKNQSDVQNTDSVAAADLTTRTEENHNEGDKSGSESSGLHDQSEPDLVERLTYEDEASIFGSGGSDPWLESETPVKSTSEIEEFSPPPIDAAFLQLLDARLKADQCEESASIETDSDQTEATAPLQMSAHSAVETREGASAIHQEADSIKLEKESQNTEVASLSESEVDREAGRVPSEISKDEQTPPPTSCEEHLDLLHESTPNNVDVAEVDSAACRISDPESILAAIQQESDSSDPGDDPEIDRLAHVNSIGSTDVNECDQPGHQVAAPATPDDLAASDTPLPTKPAQDFSSGRIETIASLSDQRPTETEAEEAALPESDLGTLKNAASEMTVEISSEVLTSHLTTRLNELRPQRSLLKQVARWTAITVGIIVPGAFLLWMVQRLINITNP